MNKEKLLVRILARLPYSNQITNVDMSSELEAIRFTWRGTRFRVSGGMGLPYVEEVEGQMLSGSNISILLQGLLRNDPSNTQ